MNHYQRWILPIGIGSALRRQLGKFRINGISQSHTCNAASFCASLCSHPLVSADSIHDLLALPLD